MVKYVDREMLPHLTGARKIGLGVYTALAADNVVSAAMKYKDHPAIAMLPVVDADGNVDIDKLYQAVYPMFSDGQKQAINIPLIGEYQIDRADVEKLYQYIRG